jgi:dTDP-4-dehydrorhamnose 3,5-epimerase
MMRLEIQSLPMTDLKLVQRQHLGDTRGHLSRLFCSEELARAGWTTPVAQINFSATARCGTVRGMHFQYPPHAEFKLVSCLRGAVWDVAVDLRAGSPTFLQWHAEQLSAENGFAMLIPAGFAHGFQTLSDDVELLYCHSCAYQPESEGALDALDPRLAITWPVNVTERSARDCSHAPLGNDFEGLRL